METTNAVLTTMGMAIINSPAVPGTIKPSGIYEAIIANVATIMGATSSLALFMAACQGEMP